VKTLAVVNGDLMVGQNGHTTISGAIKVRQDLAMALGEYWGTDRFHADVWGSVVPDFLGQPIDATTEVKVRTEVERVIRNYLAIQDQEVYQDMLNGRRSRFATADVIREVDGIDAVVLYDSIDLTVRLRTQSGTEIELNRTVTL
jgi:phage baseplate assembly protein W